MTDTTIHCERVVLGAVLLDNAQLRQVALQPRDFSVAAHGQLFEVARRMIGAGTVTDAITIAEVLERETGRKDWIQIAGSMQRDCLAPANASTYAAVVRKASLQRQAAAIGRRLVAGGDDAVSNAIRDLIQLNSITREHACHISDAINDAMDELTEIVEGKPPGVRTGMRDLDDALGGMHDEDLIVVGARPAMGKAQPVDESVLTPDGWRPMGSIAVGSHVIGCDGLPTKVIGVFPQGIKQVWRVNFADGRSVRCTEDHLWAVSCSRWPDRDRVVTTGELAAHTGMVRNRLRIRTRPFADRSAFHSDLPVDPYLLGIILGAEHKHIPPQYMAADSSARAALLQGLMDSDGWVENFRCVRFASASRALAMQVRELVWSLGGEASMRIKRTPGLPSFVVTIRVNDPSSLFRLERKRTPLRGMKRDIAPRIVSAEPTDEMIACQCIKVDAQDSLYVTRDYVVTHNTAFMLNAALAANVGVGVISGEQGRAQIGMRAFAMQGAVSLHHMRIGKLGDDEWSRVAGAIGELKSRRFWINDKPAPTIDEVISQARAWKFHNDIGLLMIDYLQKIRGGEGKDFRLQVGDIAVQLKNLARELQIPVVALAQVKREVETRPLGHDGLGRMPYMSDLAEAGIIEQEADQVITLYRPEAYDDSPMYQGIAYTNICKNRHGPVGHKALSWRGEYLKFGDLARTEMFQDRWSAAP